MQVKKRDEVLPERKPHQGQKKNTIKGELSDSYSTIQTHCLHLIDTKEKTSKEGIGENGHAPVPMILTALFPR